MNPMTVFRMDFCSINYCISSAVVVFLLQFKHLVGTVYVRQTNSSGSPHILAPSLNQPHLWNALDLPYRPHHIQHCGLPLRFLLQWFRSLSPSSSINYSYKVANLEATSRTAKSNVLACHKQCQSFPSAVLEEAHWYTWYQLRKHMALVRPSGKGAQTKL
jgi:hypothetical protein